MVFFQSAAVETLLELKQKEYTNVLFELPPGINMDTFFRIAAEIGLGGEGVHFVLVSLDFHETSIEVVEAKPNMNKNKKSPKDFGDVDSNSEKGTDCSKIMK